MKKLLVVLAGLVVLYGCAFTRQEVNFSPTLDVVSSNVGKNITLAVRVIDERPSKSLGRRGSAYGPAAEITEAQELAVVVQQQVIDGLRKKGFNPVAYGEKKDPRLTVEIRLLDYSTSIGLWTGGVQIKGALKAVAVRAGNNYERLYRSDREESVVFVPTAKRNEYWINYVLTDVIRQLFEDNELFRFLAG